MNKKLAQKLKNKEVLTNDEFAKMVLDIAKRAKPCKPKKHYVWHNKIGNILEYCQETPVKVATYAEYVNPYLTLKRSQIDDKIIGFEIWSAKQFMTKCKRAMKRKR